MRIKKFFPALIFTPIFFLYFYPFIFNFNSLLIGHFGDKTGIGYNIRRNVPIFPNQPLMKIVAPFYELLGEAPAYVALTLLSFIITFIATYIFFKKFFGKNISAVLATVFCFSPYHVIHAHNHLVLAQIWVLPLFLLGLLWLEKEFVFKKAIVVGLLLTLITLLSNYYGYLLVLFTICFFVVRSGLDFATKQKELITKRLLSYIVLAVIFAVTTVPVLIPYFRANYNPQSVEAQSAANLPMQLYRGFTDFVGLSARPWYYVLPSVQHPVFGEWSQSIHDKIASTGYFLNDDFFAEEHSGIFLGWTNLVLVGVAILVVLRRVPRTKSKTSWIITFSLVAVLLALLSGPPFFTISGNTINTPSMLLATYFPMFRSLARFGILVLLCVLILVGYALEYFKKASSVYTLLLICYLLLALFEFYQPFSYVDVSKPPAVYEWLSQQPAGVVFERPVGSVAESLFWDSVHHHNLAAIGVVDGTFPDADNMAHFVGDLVYGDLPFSALTDKNISYIVFHRGKEGIIPWQEEERFWNSCPELEVVADFEDVVVFKITSAQ